MVTKLVGSLEDTLGKVLPLVSFFCRKTCVNVYLVIYREYGIYGCTNFPLYNERLIQQNKTNHVKRGNLDV